MGMNGSNALGFLAFGAVMGLLPRLAPGWFPPNGFDGTSARAIWLEAMGVIQVGLGSSYLVKHYLLLPALRWSAARPPAEKPAALMLPGVRGADLG